MLLLGASPGDGPRARRRRRRTRRGSGILRDTRLYSLAVLYAASLGLSVVIGNWVVTLLHRQGGLDKGSAGAIGALTLALGIVTRPLGGWILHARPERMRAAVGASLLAGAAGTLLLAAAKPPALAAVGAALVGSGCRDPLRARVHRCGADAARTPPAAAVGLVNGAASVVALVGTPLLGLSFSLPGGGRAGFVVVAALWLGAFARCSRARRELGASAPTAAPRSPSG